MAEEIKEVRVIDSTGKNVFDEESSTLRAITHLTASIENMTTVLETMTEDFHDLSLSISNLTDGFNKLSSLLEKMAEAKTSKISKKIRRKRGAR
jgi:regulator of replication initiation timing